jgi:hypothetical protein
MKMLRSLLILTLTATALACGGGSDSFCYEYSCGGGDTGKQCFETMTAYCASVCTETDSCAVADCNSNCR